MPCQGSSCGRQQQQLGGPRCQESSGTSAGLVVCRHSLEGLLSLCLGSRSPLSLILRLPLHTVLALTGEHKHCAVERRGLAVPWSVHLQARTHKGKARELRFCYVSRSSERRPAFGIEMRLLRGLIKSSHASYMDIISHLQKECERLLTEVAAHISALRQISRFQVCLHHATQGRTSTGEPSTS